MVTEESAVIPHLSAAGDMTDEQARAVAGAALGKLVAVGLRDLVRDVNDDDDDDDDDDEYGPPLPSLGPDLTDVYAGAEHLFKAAAAVGLLKWRGTTRPRNGLVWTVRLHARPAGNVDRCLPLNMSMRRPECTVVSAGQGGIGASHSLVSWERMSGKYPTSVRNSAKMAGVRGAAVCRHCGVVRTDLAGAPGRGGRKRVWVAQSDWRRWVDWLARGGPLDGPPEKVKKNSRQQAGPAD